MDTAILAESVAGGLVASLSDFETSVGVSLIHTVPQRIHSVWMLTTTIARVNFWTHEWRDSEECESEGREPELGAPEFGESAIIGFARSDSWGADLDGANLEGALVGSTTFGSLDMSSIGGLDSVRHDRPSTIGVDSIIRSKGRIPELFLRGVGLPDFGLHIFRRWLGTASSSFLASSATAAWISPSPFSYTTPSSPRELDAG